MRIDFEEIVLHLLLPLLGRPASVDSLVKVHEELLKHVEHVLLAWPAISMAAGLMGILPYLRIYKSYASHVTPMATKQIESISRSDVSTRPDLWCKTVCVFVVALFVVKSVQGRVVGRTQTTV